MLLQQALRRTHTRIAISAVAVASMLLLTAGLVALRANTQDNLDLMARALVYNVEAALVFGDREDAAESLARMVQNEGVAAATVLDAKEQVFAQWQAPGRTPGSHLARLLGMKQARQTVQANGTVIGYVELHSNGQRMLAFLLWGGLALMVCMAASMAVGHVVSRRMHRSIVSPLEALGRVARAAHRERAMGQRVPRTEIAELDELGEHFNALLDELEARQLHLQQENLALEHKAYHDGLTGVFNRVCFELRLLAALRQCAPTGERLALLFLDLNHFKAVNDNHGHAAGDQLLQAVAERVQRQVRDGDLVARLGGDEFVVLLRAPHSRESAQRVAWDIQAAVQLPLPMDSGVVVHPSVSIGVAMFPEDGHTMEALMANADSAMYASKMQGRSARAQR